MRILGIDPGTSCGWALREPSGAYTSGVWDLKPSRHEGGGMRFVRLRGYLNALHRDSGGIDLLFYEEVRSHKGATASHIYGGIIAKLTEFCEDESIPYQGIAVGTIKRLATGKGNASKQMMIEAADNKWGTWTVFDDNEADARWIAEAGLVTIGDVKGASDG